MMDVQGQSWSMPTMAMHPHRIVKKTLRLDPDKLA
jgi:hypothetical protein